MAKKKVNGFTRYDTYFFMEQDPVVDIYRYVKRKSGLSDNEIADKARISRSTPKAWISKKTRSPKFATMAAALVAAGEQYVPITPEARRKFREGIE